MLAPKALGKKKIIILSIVIAVVLAAAGFIIYKKFVSSEGGQSLIDATASGPGLTPPPRLETGLFEGVFKNELFKNLRQAVQLPIEAGEVGRTNPFQKFQED